MHLYYQIFWFLLCRSTPLLELPRTRCPIKFQVCTILNLFFLNNSDFLYRYLGFEYKRLKWKIAVLCVSNMSLPLWKPNREEDRCNLQLVSKNDAVSFPCRILILKNRVQSIFTRPWVPWPIRCIDWYPDFWKIKWLQWCWWLVGSSNLEVSTLETSWNH